MIILEAIEETIKLGRDTEEINISRLEKLRDKYKLWISGKRSLDDIFVAGIFVASKFPNVKREHEPERWKRMSEFFSRRH